MKLLLFSILISFAAASGLKLLRAGRSKTYDFAVGYEIQPFFPPKIVEVCGRDGLLPGVIRNEEDNEWIVGVTPDAEKRWEVKVPYYQIGLYAEDQELKWLDKSVPSNYSNLPKGTEIPSGIAFFAIDPHGTDGRKPGEWFVLPLDQAGHGVFCGIYI